MKVNNYCLSFELIDFCSVKAFYTFRIFLSIYWILLFIFMTKSLDYNETNVSMKFKIIYTSPTKLGQGFSQIPTLHYYRGVKSNITFTCWKSTTTVIILLHYLEKVTLFDCRFEWKQSWLTRKRGHQLPFCVVLGL